MSTSTERASAPLETVLRSASQSLTQGVAAELALVGATYDEVGAPAYDEVDVGGW